MEPEYIIVQAGGRGTRLAHLTKNKPKALVPVENLPMLFHLFDRFPDKRFLIIADYKKEVLREYLECFAKVKFLVVDACGTGTCAGVGRALALLPEGQPFLLVWSDLILPKEFTLPECSGNYIGVSQTFPCRWRYEDGVFEERVSVEHGVAGLFLFEEKNALSGVPESGELVRWMGERGISFRPLGLAGTREFGLLSEYEKLGVERCRPFNRITMDGDVVIKEGIDAQGKALAVREAQWYAYAAERGVRDIPAIYGTDPLRMERVKGESLYAYDKLTYDEKLPLLRRLTEALHTMHAAARVPADPFSLKEAYYGKTMARLRTVRDLIPFADRKTVTVNGRECRNVFFYPRELERRLDALPCDSFALIHGDCTFSNIILRDRKLPVFIDPRGYFGYNTICGDPSYDWAKLYYSIVGNYDRFNLKEFRLDIGEEDVTLRIASNRWEDMERDFFAMSGANPSVIRLLHAVIWLSLTTYAWQDYDSVCGAFYNGLYYLEEALDETI